MHTNHWEASPFSNNHYYCTRYANFSIFSNRNFRAVSLPSSLYRRPHNHWLGVRPHFSRCSLVQGSDGSQTLCVAMGHADRPDCGNYSTFRSLTPAARVCYFCTMLFLLFQQYLQVSYLLVEKTHKQSKTL